MIQIQKASKAFRLPNGSTQTGVEALDLEVAEGELLCLIGSSGCGKTTTLRLINRLVEPDEGTVRVAGVDVAEQDPIRLRRGMGYVVQRGGLFPHLTVFANIALLGKLEGWTSERTQSRVFELMELVRLPPSKFKDRFPNELSGGQQQRVGVARALALDPPIVLLDEPFGALDPITRRELQIEFMELRSDKRKTMVLVTHDLQEAFFLADRVALMEKGRIVQIGTPEQMRNSPVNESVERFVSQQLYLGGRP